MRKMRKLLLTLLASTLTSVATSGMDSKSGWMLYEPDLPECLKK
ncbi:cyclic lactone autoinducer peptide [Garciella nitratireducens]|nr:cyclic lactone autoinducer peptide [Garciella nitratireducens]RBP38700.1 cyclic lactone autoinducer peptide [Garciella nitratireducens]